VDEGIDYIIIKKDRAEQNKQLEERGERDLSRKAKEEDRTNYSQEVSDI
jgi:hypothetical protein